MSRGPVGGPLRPDPHPVRQVASPAKDLFARAAHGEAVARISFCVAESALGVITGDVGAGKTVAVRAAVAGLDPTRHQSSTWPTRPSGPAASTSAIVRALGRRRPGSTRPRSWPRPPTCSPPKKPNATAGWSSSSTRPTCSTPAQLEELRLLTNAEMDSASPFAGILVGQPTLASQLRMGIFAALDQRIATRYHIKAMDLGESVAYLRHHLASPAASEPLFADDAVARLHRVANGLPRALNNAATAALIAAAADGKDLVDDACAKKAAAELTRD